MLSIAVFLALFLFGGGSLASATGYGFGLNPAFYSPTSPAPARAPNWHPPMNVQDACDTDNDTFLAGEKITYKLYYNWNFVWLSAGEVVFQVNELPEFYHITVTGTTYESYEWFYKVRDRYESYIDKETLLPAIHIKDVQEGGYLRYDRTTFDQIDHKAVSARGRTRDDLKSETIDFDGCMHDLISTMYWARNLKYEDMQVNQEIPIKIMMDRKIYPLQVKYLGARKGTDVKGVGQFNTREFSPQLIAGDVFKEGDEMKIFVTDDQNKIPVLIESPVVVGSVKAVLHKYEGLMYPVTAKVK
ncbi:hypothetical protein A3850_001705 [Lewinella sp. 4G2]|nr:hypothetical protein A3850_001705 [Lewinella sp. 4G2]